MSRDQARSAFLDAAGWGGAEVVALPGDASFRRYFRLDHGSLAHSSKGRALLMDASPPQENVRPFLHVDDLLRSLGLSAPEIFARDEAAGFLLLEDFGDDTFTRLLRQGEDEGGLYDLALDVLIALQKKWAPALGAGLPRYDHQRLLDEALLLPDWFLPAVTGKPTPPGVRRDYIAAWDQVLPLAQAVSDTLVLRDYHVDNLMVIPGRSGLAACGLLDFQDAVIGPVSYDLMSLYEDARRDVSADVAAAGLQRFLSAFPDLDAAAFMTSFRVLAAGRHAKVIGIFTRLLVRDGKPVYLPHIPRVWRLLDHNLAFAELQPVAQWFAAYVPQDLRKAPEP